MNNSHELILSLERAKIEFSRKITSTASDLKVDTSKYVRDIENIDKLIAIIRAFNGMIKLVMHDNQSDFTG